MGRNWGLGGLFVHGVHAFEEGEEGAQVVFSTACWRISFDELLAGLGAAGVDRGDDLSNVGGRGAQKGEGVKSEWGRGRSCMNKLASR